MPVFKYIKIGAILAAAAVSAAAYAATPAPARADAAEVLVLPASEIFGQVPGCSGENVDLVGDIGVVLRLTDTGQKVIVGQTFHSQGIEGFGALTGDRYVVTLSLTVTSTNPQSILHIRSHITAKKPGSSLLMLLEQTIHLTVTPDGRVTADIAESSQRCIGA